MTDTSGVFHAKSVHETVRGWSSRRLDTAIFTHGHIDHVFGVELYEGRPVRTDWVPAKVVAHPAFANRFAPFANSPPARTCVINPRQFRVPSLQLPSNFRYPDETVTDRLTGRRAQEATRRYELFHALGEMANGATCVWIPDARVLCTGDLFIWASPNCGNPQKVQRFPPAVEPRRCARWTPQLKPELLFPGHGCRSSAPRASIRRSPKARSSWRRSSTRRSR